MGNSPSLPDLCLLAPGASPPPPQPFVGSGSSVPYTVGGRCSTSHTALAAANGLAGNQQQQKQRTGVRSASPAAIQRMSPREWRGGAGAGA